MCLNLWPNGATEGRNTEWNVRKQGEGRIRLSEFLSVWGGRWVGGSINHSQSFIFSCSYHFSSIGSGRESVHLHFWGNCWKAVSASKIYGCIDVYIWCFCSELGGEDKCACCSSVHWRMRISASCLEGRGFFFFENLPCFFSFSGLSVPHE